jgi:hypothetical protein
MTPLKEFNEFNQFTSNEVAQMVNCTRFVITSNMMIGFQSQVESAFIVKVLWVIFALVIVIIRIAFSMIDRWSTLQGSGGANISESIDGNRSLFGESFLLPLLCSTRVNSPCCVIISSPR